MTLAFIFPGQGSQTVGMAADLIDSRPVAKAVFDEVDEALGQSLSKIILNGPEEDLTLTENTQPAIMAASIATWRVLEEEFGQDTLYKMASFMAGHSLGEYSALCAAGVMSLADTAKLLKLRGQSMQQAVPVGQGAMAALIGMDYETVTKLCVDVSSETSQVCALANDNCPGQIVISGHKDAVDHAMQKATELGAKKAVPLSVSAPFHCSLMQPAADTMQTALTETTMNVPHVPIIPNVTVQSCSDIDQLRDNLVKQITGQVRWRETVEFMKGQGVTNYFEIGPGKVLSGLVKRVDRALVGQPINSLEDIQTLNEFAKAA